MRAPSRMAWAIVTPASSASCSSSRFSRGAKRTRMLVSSRSGGLGEDLADKANLLVVADLCHAAGLHVLGELLVALGARGVLGGARAALLGERTEVLRCAVAEGLPRALANRHGHLQECALSRLLGQGGV